MTGLYIALIAWLLMLPLFLSIGVNKWRYARTLNLDWPIYVEAVFWVMAAMLSCLRWVSMAYTLATKGVPESFAGVGLLAWMGLGVGLPFIAFMAVGSWVALRNARERNEAERVAAAEMHNAIFRLQNKLDSGGGIRSVRPS